MTHPASMLKEIWKVYGRNLKSWLIVTSPLVGLAAVFSLASALMTQKSWSALGSWSVLIFLVLTAAATVAGVAFKNASVIAANDTLSGKPIRYKESFRQGLKFVWPVLWTSVVRCFLIIAGSLLLIVPGIYWAVRYSQVTSVILLEGKRGRAAFSRSREIVSGKFLEASIDYLVMGVIIGLGTWLAFVGVTLVILILGEIAAFAAPSAIDAAVSAVFFWAAMAAELGVVWLAVPFAPMSYVAIYRDLNRAG